MLTTKRLLLILCLSLISSSVMAQGLARAQKKKVEGVSIDNSQISPSQNESSSQPQKSVAEKCEDKTLATNLPRFLLQKLFENEDTGEFSFSPEDGKLVMSADRMIQNCSDMVSFYLNAPDSNTDFYALEAKIDHPASANAGEKSKEECEADSSCNCYKEKNERVPVCRFKVFTKENGLPKDSEKFFKVDYTGFEQCLKDTGAYSAKFEPQVDNMYFAPVVEKFDMKETAQVKLKSHNSFGIGPLYGPKKPEYRGCYFFEEIEENGVEAVTAADQATRAHRDSLLADFQKTCENREFDKIFNNIDQYKTLGLDVEQIAKKAIENDYRKIMEKISRARSKKDVDKIDTSIIKDFRNYIVDPLIDKMSALSEAIATMDDGDARDAKIEELDKLETQLQNYVKNPYLTQADRDRMVDKQAFDMAFELTTILNRVNHFTSANLQDKYPETIWDDVKSDNKKYDKLVKNAEEEIEIRAGNRPHAAEDTFEEAMRLKEEMAYEQQDLQATMALVYADVQRECPYMLTASKAQTAQYERQYGPCESFDYMKMLYEESAEYTKKMDLEVKKLIAKADEYDKIYKKAQGKDDSKLTARERYEKNRSRYSSTNYSMNMNTNFNANMSSNPYLTQQMNSQNMFNQQNPFSQFNYQQGYNGYSPYNMNYGNSGYPMGYQNLMNPSMGLNLSVGAGMNPNMFSSGYRQPAFSNQGYGSMMGNYNMYQPMPYYR